VAGAAVGTGRIRDRGTVVPVVGAAVLRTAMPALVRQLVAAAHRLSWTSIGRPPDLPPFPSRNMRAQTFLQHAGASGSVHSLTPSTTRTNTRLGRNCVVPGAKLTQPVAADAIPRMPAAGMCRKATLGFPAFRRFRPGLISIKPGPCGNVLIHVMQ
jgi:hypothetical protein